MMTPDIGKGHLRTSVLSQRGLLETVPHLATLLFGGIDGGHVGRVGREGSPGSSAVLSP